MTSPAVIPPVYAMSQTEARILPFDPTSYLAVFSDTSVSSASSTLVYTQGSGGTVSIASPTVVTGGDPEIVINQLITGSTQLAQTGRYLLTVNFTSLPSGSIWAAELILNVGL